MDEELKERCVKILGIGCQRKIAELSGYSARQVNRWWNGGGISIRAEKHIRLIIESEEANNDKTL